jgi:hypothetical protein
MFCNAMGARPRRKGRRTPRRPATRPRARPRCPRGRMGPTGAADGRTRYAHPSRPPRTAGRRANRRAPPRRARCARRPRPALPRRREGAPAAAAPRSRNAGAGGSADADALARRALLTQRGRRRSGQGAPPHPPPPLPRPGAPAPPPSPHPPAQPPRPSSHPAAGICSGRHVSSWGAGGGRGAPSSGRATERHDSTGPASSMHPRPRHAKPEPDRNAGLARPRGRCRTGSAPPVPARAPRRPQPAQTGPGYRARAARPPPRAAGRSPRRAATAPAPLLQKARARAARRTAHRPALAPRPRRHRHGPVQGVEGQDQGDVQGRRRRARPRGEAAVGPRRARDP